MEIIVISLLVLGGLGLLVAVLLYFVSQRFKVEENPLIEEVEAILPGANCGGCGFAGCKSLAEACVKADTLENIFCPVGGSAVMDKISEKLGLSSSEGRVPQVAVVRCNGTCEVRQRTSVYDGVRSCKIMHSLYVGESDCPYGCLGCGDCVSACKFDAIHINVQTGLAEVDEDRCVACGQCVKACPRGIIELRNKGIKNRRMVVLCVNKDKGVVARKACTNACIGCGKCMKVCEFDAIKVENNVAYIDFNACRLCRKCEKECPTGAIHAINFPARPKVAEEVEKTAMPTEAEEAKREPQMEVDRGDVRAAVGDSNTEGEKKEDNNSEKA